MVDINQHASALPGNKKKKAAAPLRVGQKVHVDSLRSLGTGEGARESRLKGAAESLGGIAVSVGISMSVKALIPIVFAIAAPEFATAGVPAAIAVWSTYVVGKSALHLQEKLDKDKKALAKKHGFSGKQALLMAIRTNKLAVGAFIGSMLMLGLGMSGESSHLMKAFPGGHGENAGGAPKLLKSLLSHHTPRLPSTRRESQEVALAASFAGANMKPVAKAFAKAKRLVHANPGDHLPDLAERASTARTFLRGRAPKGADIHTPAQALHKGIKTIRKSLTRLTPALATLQGKASRPAPPFQKQPSRS